MALQSAALCFTVVGSNPRFPTNRFSGSLIFKRESITATVFPSLVSSLPRRCNLQGKAFPGDTGSPDTNDSSFVVCFGEMPIDFVLTINGLSLADAPAFKKAPGGAPANVVVGISRFGGSSAFIGKVGEDEFGYMLADILKENNVNSD